MGHDSAGKQSDDGQMAGPDGLYSERRATAEADPEKDGMVETRRRWWRRRRRWSGYIGNNPPPSPPVFIFIPHYSIVHSLPIFIILHPSPPLSISPPIPPSFPLITHCITFTAHLPLLCINALFLTSHTQSLFPSPPLTPPLPFPSFVMRCGC